MGLFFEVAVEPAVDFAQAGKAFAGLAAAAEFVVFADEAAHFAFDASGLEGGEHLGALGEFTAEVVDALDEQQGCGATVGVFEG